MTNEEILQIFDEEKTPYWCLLHKKSKGTLGECGKQGGKEDRTLAASRAKLATKLNQYQSYPCVVYFFDTKEELLEGLKNKDSEKMPCISFAETTVVKSSTSENIPSVTGIPAAPYLPDEDIEKRASDKFQTFRLEFELAQLKKEISDLREENRNLKQHNVELERELEKSNSNTINSFVGAVSPFLPMIQQAFGVKTTGTINGLPQQKKRTMKETIVKRMPADELSLLEEIKRIEPEAWKTLLSNIIRLHDEDPSTYNMARKFLI